MGMDASDSSNSNDSADTSSHYYEEQTDKIATAEKNVRAQDGAQPGEQQVSADGEDDMAKSQLREDDSNKGALDKLKLDPKTALLLPLLQRLAQGEKLPKLLKGVKVKKLIKQLGGDKSLKKLDKTVAKHVKGKKTKKLVRNLVSVKILKQLGAKRLAKKVA
jgi:hypothetical protein